MNISKVEVALLKEEEEEEEIYTWRPLDTILNALSIEFLIL